jgi:hypothetical protein
MTTNPAEVLISELEKKDWYRQMDNEDAEELDLSILKLSREKDEQFKKIVGMVLDSKNSSESQHNFGWSEACYKILKELEAKR